MSNRIKILFWLFKARKNSKGLVPLMLRISYQTDRIQMSTGFFIEESKWDKNKDKLKGNSDEAKQVNDYIRNTTNRLMEIFIEQLKEGDIYLNKILDQYQGKDNNNMT